MDALNTLLEQLLTSARGLGLSFIELLPVLAVGLVIALVAWGLSKGASSIAGKVGVRLTDDSSLQRLFQMAVKTTVLMAGIFFAATIVFPDLGIGDFVAVLGLSSVALGFAFKDIFQNFLAGIIILSRRPFRIGDQIEVDGIEGTITEVNIRSSSMRTYDGQTIVVPNAVLFQNSVTVRTADTERRSTFETGIGYDEDIEKAREVMLEATRGCEGVLDDHEVRVLVTEHAGSSVNFRIDYWTASDIASVVKGRDAVATAVKYALDNAGIGIPFPQRTLHVQWPEQMVSGFMNGAATSDNEKKEDVVTRQ